jgi:hypothetical protein
METILRKITRNNLSLGGAAILASSIFLSRSVTVGLLAGTALITADLWLIAVLTRRILNSGSRRLAIPLALLLTKFFLFLAVAWALLRFVPMNPYAFGAGVAVIVFTTAATVALNRGPSVEA